MIICQSIFCYIKQYSQEKKGEISEMQSQSSTKISNEKKVQLIKAQQGELDAVIVYRRLAEAMKEFKNEKVLLRIAADEGKHAGILRKYTGATLRASKFKASVVIVMYRTLGLKFTLNVLRKGELKAVKGYALLVEEFPKLDRIISDEAMHADLIKNMS